MDLTSIKIKKFSFSIVVVPWIARNYDGISFWISGYFSTTSFPDNSVLRLELIFKGSG